MSFEVEYLTEEKRGPGYYWWITGYDEDKIGPFLNRKDAVQDTFRRVMEDS